ncbi:MAG TPA: redoxin domain-containing protein [Steroidobacteraceae bacterium]|jgi:peroxiredoxin|nr:redoxin domain-containing protein [Steroidobacteraceae bacterium]
MPQRLQNGQVFPQVEIPAMRGGVLKLPDDLAGSFGVVLIYRGHWCAFCNEQMAAFARAHKSLAQARINVVAFSVDDEAATKDLIVKHRIPFKMGHSARIETVVHATGAFESESPKWGRFLETTGFVLSPKGAVVNAVYSSRAIGRLVPGDVIRLVEFLKSQAK